jgi:tRNA pseudouridine32 synthase/23S rRNA pseudouridine746 synthase
MHPLTIYSSDRDQVVVEKPYGLLSEPGRECADSLLTRLQAQGFPTVIAVHRLDMQTSGIMLFALRRKAEAELKRQFREHLVQKEYLAWVQGAWGSESGTIELPLRFGGKHEVTGWPRHEVDLLEGKAATTHYTLLRRTPTATLLRLSPLTGRSHQLRVHCAALGHPIVGDAIYGNPNAERMYLHAHSISWLHPYSQLPLQMKSALPLDEPKAV